MYVTSVAFIEVNRARHSTHHSLNHVIKCLVCPKDANIPNWLSWTIELFHNFIPISYIISITSIILQGLWERRENYQLLFNFFNKWPKFHTSRHCLLSKAVFQAPRPLVLSYCLCSIIYRLRQFYNKWQQISQLIQNLPKSGLQSNYSHNTFTDHWIFAYRASHSSAFTCSGLGVTKSSLRLKILRAAMCRFTCQNYYFCCVSSKSKPQQKI